MKQIKDEDLRFELSANVDDTPVRGNALASGDDAEDKACEDKIIARLESGNVWAWASVRVRCWHKDLPDVIGVDYLGACSYRDEDEFKQCGYYECMREQAKTDLLSQLEKIGKVICC